MESQTIWLFRLLSQADYFQWGLFLTAALKVVTIQLEREFYTVPVLLFGGWQHHFL